MFAFEKAGGCGHGGFVERPGIVERAAVIEGWENAATIDAVAVRFALGQPARMKIVTDFFADDDADRGRKKGVEGTLEFFGREKRSCFEMANLTEGVDAGVGAARAVHDDSFLGDFARGGVNFALDRWEAGLELPTVEVSSLVGDGEFDVSHAQQDYRTWDHLSTRQ